LTARSIFLVGLRGTGKSTVGRLLANELALPFLDADEELEFAESRSIVEIFRAFGEAGFRDREEKCLEKLIARGPAVVATGGGVVLREANRQRMKAAGKVVWLTADPATLWQRLERDSNTLQRRPPLSTGDITEVEEVLRAREPMYRALADFTISAQDRSPQQIVADIVALCSTSS